MLVLAVDTSTPAVTVGIVDSESGNTLASRVTYDARAHTEVCVPQISDCLREAGVTPAGVGAVVVGIGPGPFTGLRVGMATAAAFGDAIGVPVHGVCSLDAIAVGVPGELLVVTDARRREVYWARYSDGTRVAGPTVGAVAEPAAAVAVAGSRAHAEVYGLPVVAPSSPLPRGLVAVADLEQVPGPLEPMYLRRPDAVEPKLSGRKQ